MFRCALLMYVLCGSVCRRTVFVYLTTGSMKYRVLRGFCLGFGELAGVCCIWFGLLGFCFVLFHLRMIEILTLVLFSVFKED